MDLGYLTCPWFCQTLALLFEICIFRDNSLSNWNHQDHLKSQKNIDDRVQWGLQIQTGMTFSCRPRTSHHFSMSKQASFRFETSNQWTCKYILMNPQINELAAVLFAVNCKTKPKQTSRAKKKIHKQTTCSWGAGEV